MFNRVLVPVDLSEMSREVFKQALTIAKLTSGNLMLLHVLSQEEEGTPEALIFPNIDYYPGWNEQTFRLYQEHWDKFKQESLQMLQSFTAEANTSGVQAEFTQSSGSPGRKICELATLWNADLIIMGRRGRSGIAEFFLGSVSNYVLHHATCTVQIVNLPVTSSNRE
ncbi:MAG: universal stress protein [Cuspidothrix sp.]